MSPASPTDARPVPSQRIAELLLESANDYAIFTMDREGVINSWSPGARRITGYEAEEAVGASFAKLFTASDIAAGHDRRELETALRDGRAEDSRWHLRKDGERFWANGVTFRPPGAGFRRTVEDRSRRNFRAAGGRAARPAPE